MRNMKELTSHKKLEQFLINDDLLYVKIQDEETTRLFVAHILEPSSFLTFLINVERLFKYPNQEEGKYNTDLIDSKLIVYEPITDENQNIINGRIVKAYDIIDHELIPNCMLPDSFLENHFSEVGDDTISFQKRIGKMQ